MKRTQIREEELYLDEKMINRIDQRDGEYQEVRYHCPRCTANVTSLVDKEVSEGWKENFVLNYCPQCGLDFRIDYRKK